MLQTGMISGVVRDSLGAPLGNAEVQAFKATYQTGRRVLTKVQSVQSDDRGEYRLFWLTPGKYFVAARHVGGIRVGGGGPGRAGGPARYQQFRTGGDNASAAPFAMDRQQAVKEKYMAIYYPNTTDESSAAAIDVTPGGEARPIDFAVAPVPMQRVAAVWCMPPTTSRRCRQGSSRSRRRECRRPTATRSWDRCRERLPSNAVILMPQNRPGLLAGAYVKSIRLGGADLLNNGLHLDAEPEQAVEIVISNEVGALEGRVIDRNRQPVPNVD